MKSSHPIPSRLSAAFPALAIAAVLSFPWPAAVAAPVSSEQAAAAVTGWLSLDQTPLGEALGTSVQRVDTFSDKSGNPLYYLVYLDPAGFVIVAADDLVEPIIGFASAGRFDPAQDNPLGALVSKDLADRVAYARKAGAVPADAKAAQAQAKWQQLCPKDGGPVTRPKGLTSISDVRIAPLTQTTWSQKTAADAGTSACYNYYTPPNGDGSTANYPAGCVATAIGAIHALPSVPGHWRRLHTVYGLLRRHSPDVLLARRRWLGGRLCLGQHAAGASRQPNPRPMPGDRRAGCRRRRDRQHELRRQRFRIVFGRRPGCSW